jgi:hypothetical protein
MGQYIEKCLSMVSQIVNIFKGENQTLTLTVLPLPLGPIRAKTFPACTRPELDANIWTGCLVFLSLTVTSTFDHENELTPVFVRCRLSVSSFSMSGIVLKFSSPCEVGSEIWAAIA